MSEIPIHIIHTIRTEGAGGVTGAGLAAPISSVGALEKAAGSTRKLGGETTRTTHTTNQATASTRQLGLETTRTTHATSEVTVATKKQGDETFRTITSTRQSTVDIEKSGAAQVAATRSTKSFTQAVRGLQGMTFALGFGLIFTTMQLQRQNEARRDAERAIRDYGLGSEQAIEAQRRLNEVNFMTNIQLGFMTANILQAIPVTYQSVKALVILGIAKWKNLGIGRQEIITNQALIASNLALSGSIDKVTASTAAGLLIGGRGTNLLTMMRTPAAVGAATGAGTVASVSILRRLLNALTWMSGKSAGLMSPPILTKGIAEQFAREQGINITPMAKGGIFTKPTLSMIAENEPEIVAPISSIVNRRVAPLIEQRSLPSNRGESVTPISMVNGNIGGRREATPINVQFNNIIQGTAPQVDWEKVNREQERVVKRMVYASGVV